MNDNRIYEINSRRIMTLTPDTREVAVRHISQCKDEGISLLVVQASRSIKDQSRIYAIGRTSPGKVVTNAAPGWSWHNFGRAYDIVVMVDGMPDWDCKYVYERVGEIGTSIGLIWGGSFRYPKGDLGHFEYHPGITLTDARAEVGFTV